MLDAIGAARRSIHLEMYHFESDRTGWRFAQALANKASDGVRVRVIYDHAGSFFTDPRLWSALRHAGAEVRMFHPLAPWKPGWNWMRRDHRKLLVVDGSIGFTGGMNISNEYAPVSAGGEGWRDSHVRIDGPAVADLQLIFLRTWIYAGGTPPEDTRLFRAAPHPDGIRARVLANRTFQARRTIRRALLDAIRRARDTIRITHAYFMPDGILRRALGQAVERGVEVFIIVPAHSDVPLFMAAGRAAQPFLLRLGCRVFLRLGPVLHAKTVVIDGHWAMLGSSNINYRSFRLNQEVNIEVENANFAARLERRFQEDLRESREVSREDLARRPWGTKLADSLAFSLRRWL